MSTGVDDVQPIAIVGISCQMPGASNKNAFWEMLFNGREGVQTSSVQSRKVSASKQFVNRIAKSDGIFKFDPQFFGISEQTAQLLDPQHRIALELSWEAFEDAGYAPKKDPQKCGVFFSANHNTYQYLDNWLSKKWNDSKTSLSELFLAYESNCLDTLSSRIAYHLNLTGPAFTVLSACSSGLVSIHQACNALQLGECEVAIAGGVAINCFDEAGYIFEDGMMLSKKGACRSFDSSADGTIFGSGGGAVLLKELDKAVADKDHIYAVIEGSAVNNDGSRKVDFTAPSVEGQIEVIKEAALNGQVDVSTIDYIEAHGSGTILGDPIEFEALNQTYGALLKKNHACALGCVKPNVGHLDAAAGIAGFIKAALSLKEQCIPQNLNFLEPNPHIPFESSPFYVPTERVEWKGASRKCAVTSLGIGGTNAHVILGSYDSAPILPNSDFTFPFALSAKSQKALKGWAQLILEEVKSGNFHLPSLLFTLAQSRSHYEWAHTAMVSTYEEVIEQLELLVRGEVVGKRNQTIDLSIFNSIAVQRVSLPTYPFDRKEIKMGIKPQVTIQNLESGQSLRFAISIRQDADLVVDHVLRGDRVLPAAAYLDFVNQAYRTIDGKSDAVLIKNVLFLRPTIANEAASTCLMLEFEPTEDGYQFAFKNEQMEAICEGNIEGHLKIEKELDAEQGLEGTSLEMGAIYSHYNEQGLCYGPSFQVLEQAQRTDKGVVGALKGTKEWQSSQMIDGAFHSTVAWRQDEGAFVPIQMENVVFNAPLSQISTSKLIPFHSKSSKIIRYSIEIFNERGQLAFSAASCMEKRVEDTSSNEKQQITKLINNTLQSLGIYKERVELQDLIETVPFTSITAVAFKNALVDIFGPLPNALIYEGRTFLDIVESIKRNQPQAFAQKFGQNIPLVKEINVRKQQIDTNEVAIVGMSGRYPKSPNLQALWYNLKTGANCIEEIPKERWDYEPWFSDKKIASKWGGFIDGIDQFDSRFFRIANRDADLMDPQEKLFLMECWKLLEASGYTPKQLNQMADHRVGVFVGVLNQEYQLYGAENELKQKGVALNGTPSSVANRVSYFFDFRGPSLAIDTMCSGSLTALYFACQELQLGKVSAAIVGGTNINVHLNKYLQLTNDGLLSKEGLCRAFGEGGSGYVPSEGIGAILIKPLKNAIADRDHIYGVIKGIGIDHGGKTSSYSAPSSLAQSGLIKRVLDEAGVTSEQISYIEAHGTGTALGDPIELSGLQSALGRASDRKCPIGSIKSNIGHCEAAAGIAGLTKVLLQLKYKKLVPSIHSDPLNQEIPFEDLPFVVQKKLEDWNASGPRIATISSFGAGGSNAHMVIEEGDR